MKPTDTQADLTERARRLTQKLAKHFIGEQFAAEDETCRQCVAMVEAALQSEREAAAEARRALENIAGGFIPGAATDALLAGDWHPAFTALQQIAKTALASPPAPQAMIHPDQQEWRPKCVCPIGWCSVKIDGLHPYPSRCRDAKPERPPAPQEETPR